MPESQKLEKQLIQSLAKLHIRNIDDADAVAFLKKIDTLLKKKKLLEAAAHYAALAATIDKDANLALLAARGYQRADSLDSAARWYLISAERYAHMYQSSKSIAALRIYAQLKPDEKENPKRIYEICLAHGANDDNPPSILMSDSDAASGKLLATEFFETFDSADFDYLMKHLTYHRFQHGHVISKMGDQASSLYIIISGAVSGFLTAHGKRTHLGDLGENTICGETAYFTGGRRTSEMVAKGVTEVFELPYSLLDKFKTDLPSFNKRIETLYRSRMLVKQLALTPVFADVTVNCREWVAARMKPILMKAGATLFSQNDTSLDIYLVRKGKLTVTINIDNKQHLLKTVETGGIVGETAIVAQKKRTASVRASTDCILMKLSSQDFQTFYAGSEPIQKILNQIRKRHALETLDMMKNIKRVEGDDTCEMLIKESWSQA